MSTSNRGACLNRNYEMHDIIQKLHVSLVPGVHGLRGGRGSPKLVVEALRNECSESNGDKPSVVPGRCRLVKLFDCASAS
jgi:hypothetical protein